MLEEIDAALQTVSFALLFESGLIVGYRGKSLGWILTLYVGTYPSGIFVEGDARREDGVVRLSTEQARQAYARIQDP